ncbi:MAG: hypothetical protein PHQ04_03455 [Opitutaceae bacterium]|nr:hypothetical protein [Opitutaceae bacterium]
MPPPQPRTLAENAGLAYPGVFLAAAFIVQSRSARRMLAAHNPTGRPNADVLRPYVGAADLARPRGRWVIVFPPESSAAEMALYLAPFRLLQRRLRDWRKFSRPLTQAGAALLTALAKRDRFLVTPLDTRQPAFTWLESPALPDDSLLVVARDDDFTRGILHSRIFSVWWRHQSASGVPTFAVESFPFPWPPTMPLHALSSVQEEHRHAIARASRQGNSDELNCAVAAAYGWAPDLPETGILEHLLIAFRSRIAAN